MSVTRVQLWGMGGNVVGPSRQWFWVYFGIKAFHGVSKIKQGVPVPEVRIYFDSMALPIYQSALFFLGKPHFWVLFDNKFGFPRLLKFELQGKTEDGAPPHSLSRVIWKNFRPWLTKRQWRCYQSLPPYTQLLTSTPFDFLYLVTYITYGQRTWSPGSFEADPWFPADLSAAEIISTLDVQQASTWITLSIASIRFS